MKSYKTIDSDEYQNHMVFPELEKYMAFYESLSFSVYSFGAVGTNAVLNIDTHIFRSIKGTLHSIQLVLKNGRINDAYSLLRKYYDSAVINIYSNLYLDDNSSIENFIVDKIDNWLKGKDKLPEYRVMSSYIRDSEKFSEINQLLYSNNKYKNIRNRCNDSTHYNFFYNMLLNDNVADIEPRIKILDIFSVDIKDILILHLAYLFYFKDHYMSSSDYMDALECGLEPQQDSQYWVAPFIQTVFDEIIAKERPDIVEKIKQKTCMNLS